ARCCSPTEPGSRKRQVGPCADLTIAPRLATPALAIAPRCGRNATGMYPRLRGTLPPPAEDHAHDSEYQYPVACIDCHVRSGTLLIQRVHDHRRSYPAKAGKESVERPLPQPGIGRVEDHRQAVRHERDEHEGGAEDLSHAP